MNRDDIIRMAREAEAIGNTATIPLLARFAALVAAAERGECAKLCEGFVVGSPFAAAIRARGENK
jgi:hypothetical protein